MEHKLRYLTLAAGLHVLLFALLFVSVFFQHKMEVPPAIEAVLISAIPQSSPPKSAPPKPIPPKPEPPKPEPPKPEPPKPQPKEPPKPNVEQDLRKFKADIALKLDCDNITQMKMDAAMRPPEQRKIMDEMIRDRVDACRKKEEQKIKDAEAAERKQKETLRKAEELQRKQQFEQEEKRIAEDQRKREIEDQRRRQAEMAAALGAEETARVAAAKAARQRTWGDQIGEIVRRHWLRPPGSSNDFSCLVKVQLLPGGSVVSAKVIKTCGGGIALDDSVEKAVLKSEPLPMPENPEDFDRNLTFVFKPH